MSRMRMDSPAPPVLNRQRKFHNINMRTVPIIKGPPPSYNRNFISGSGKSKILTYFLLEALGITQIPSALQTRTGSSRKSAAEGLTSALEVITL